MINKVVLVGRLTKDIEVKKTPQGTSVTSFTVACNRRYQQNDQKTADFINCVAWRQSADFLGSYAKKGNLVGVEGKIETRNYDDKDGKKVYITEIICDNVQLLESRKSSDTGDSTYNNYSNINSTPPLTQNNYQQEPKKYENEDSGVSLDISSDDLPF